MPTDDDEKEEVQSSEHPNTKSKFIGPKCPFMIQNDVDDDSNSCDEKDNRTVIGPSLPESYKKSTTKKTVSSEENEDTNDVYGPMPPITQGSYDVVRTIEKRAANMKHKLDTKVCCLFCYICLF